MKLLQIKCINFLTISIGLAALIASLSSNAADNCGLANGKRATGDPIKIGAIVGKTGPEDFSSGAGATAAYFKCVNENGGINGRQIEYIVMDDAWDPKQTAHAAATLLQEKKVLAMVGNASFFDCGINGKSYEKENVAVIASAGALHDCFFLRNYAPINQGPRLSSIGIAQYVADTYNVKKVACVVPDMPVGKWICAGVEAWGKANNVDVKVFLFNPGALDPAGLVKEIAAAKPGAVVVGTVKAFAVPIFQAAEKADLGKSIHWVGPTTLYNTEMPQALGSYWDGKVEAELELQPMTNAGPDMNNWRAIMSKYGMSWREAKATGGTKDQIDTFSQAGFVAAKFATEALLGIKGPIDRATVTAALRDIKNAKSDILCGPWYFGNGSRHNANHSGRIAKISDGVWTALPTACLQPHDPELADILKFESGG